MDKRLVSGRRGNRGGILVLRGRRVLFGRCDKIPVCFRFLSFFQQILPMLVTLSGTHSGGAIARTYQKQSRQTANSKVTYFHK
jgi:hypothetical protein